MEAKAATKRTTQAAQEEVTAAEHVEVEQRVTPLELFFDLVFVFAFTQVTGLMSDNPTWEGMAQGLLVLAAVWWAWGSYSWLTNEVDPDEGVARLVMFIAMAAMLLAALAIPQAFGDDGLLFGCAYFVVRVLHILLFAAATPDVGVRMAVRHLSETAIPAPALLILAGAMDGGAQAALWCLALAIDLAGPQVRGVEGFRIHPAHFAERYGLVVIIALGESIVAIGIGVEGLPLELGEVVTAVAGIVIAGALWWAYFDVIALVAGRRLTQAQGSARTRLARDAYSYLHLPMIAGIVLLALGVKKAIADVDAPLDTVPAVALCGGVALYLLAHIGFRLRIFHSVNRQRLVVVLLALALIPVASSVDAVVAVSLIALLLVALVAYEALRFSETRARVRAAT
jgi:low temperature requirement protein LtrA